jgi:single-stranded-DNA-specific exonuclease
MAVSELVKSLLTKRGFTEESDIQAFLSPDYAVHTHDPFLMHDMEKAVPRVFEAMERHEKIAVYADYDCDGIPGAALLSDFFRKIGYTDISVYLPHRDREGYGFHTEAIDKLAKEGVKLIITVDVGTKAYEGIAHANALGIDVIVTDHHEIDPSTELPEAFALLNPKIRPPALPFDGPEGSLRPSNGSGVEGYPYPDLCGAAVAWKLVQALLIEGRGRGGESFKKIPDGWEKWLLDLVAIATVADLVPLVGENRVLAYWGLQVLRKSPRAGIRALCAALRLRQSELDETDIGFSIAPRINAASRMDSPELALRLLTTTDKKEAEDLARQLESLNSSRKGVVAGMVKEAKKRVKARFQEGDRVTVLGDPDWKPSLCGLAANSIMGERGGVVLIWGRDAMGKLKGSARSDGSISIVELFAKTSGVFEEYGGHQASGGFTVLADAVHTLPEVLKHVAAQLDAPPVEKESGHDAILALREVSSVLLKDIMQLAPYGIGNAKPVFRIPRVRILSVRRFGKDGNHTEVSLISPESHAPQRAFQFFKAPEHFTVRPAPEMEVDVLATLEKDTFRGPDRLALRIVDILHS